VLIAQLTRTYILRPPTLRHHPSSMDDASSSLRPRPFLPLSSLIRTSLINNNNNNNNRAYILLALTLTISSKANNKHTHIIKLSLR
jgi:hypothetical protein